MLCSYAISSTDLAYAPTPSLVLTRRTVQAPMVCSDGVATGCPVLTWRMGLRYRSINFPAAGRWSVFLVLHVSPRP
eukprot:469541-Rhodomonas_salina.1